MNRPYRWRCYACDKPNEASATSCASCGFPARASGADIVRARSGHGPEYVPVRHHDSRPGESVREWLVNWSGWRKGLAFAGAALLVIGVYAWKESFSWPGFGLAVLALLIGAPLFLIACVAKESHPVGEVASQAH